jgi:hypothetical protein
VTGGGRDQRGPIEQLVRLLAVLENAGLVGTCQQQLLDVARYGERRTISGGRSLASSST